MITKAHLTFEYDTETQKLTFEATFEPCIKIGQIKDLENEWEHLPDSHQMGLRMVSEAKDALKKIYNYSEVFTKPQEKD